MIATAPDSDYLKLAEEVEWTSGVGYTEREIIQYYGFLADTGDLHALVENVIYISHFLIFKVTLGTLHLVGRFGVAQDYQEAFDCFNTVCQVSCVIQQLRLQNLVNLKDLPDLESYMKMGGESQ